MSLLICINTLGPPPHLRLSDKYPMILLAGEVPFSLHRSIVLSFRLVQNDAHPFPRGKESGADVRHRPTLTLTDDLHQRAHLNRLPPTVRTHPADHTAGQLTTHTQIKYTFTKSAVCTDMIKIPPRCIMQQFAITVCF